MRATGPAAAALLLAAGCIHETQLRPTPEAQVLQGDRDAARASVAGVELVADGAAWKGTPSDLENSLTPVLVRVVNHSGRPVRLQYRDFSLVGTESRFHYAAIPPMSLQDGGARERGVGGSGREELYLGFSSGFHSGRFYGGGRWGPFVGPYHDPYFPGPYPYYYGYRCEEPLPTEDMLEQALPEGTLEDGGTVEGFLYFQGVSQRESGVVLQARIVDASNGELLGTADIPFQVRKG